MASVVTPLKRAAARAALSKTAKEAAPKRASNSNSSASTPKSNGQKKKRVEAKKTTVRAPMPVASNSSKKRSNDDDDGSDEEEMERISLGSTESLAVSEESEEGDEEDEKAVATKKRSVAKKPVAKKPAKKKTGRPKKSKDVAEEEDESEEEEEQVQTPVPVPVAVPRTRKTKTGRPKSKKPVKEIVIPVPGSPMKKSQGGRPPRVVKHFVGGQKHALMAKKIFTDPQVAIDQRPQAIVFERAVYEPEKTRRTRVPWTLEETENLQEGVMKHGEGFWADILNDPELAFNHNRTQIDLKDKWRNLTSYVKYQEHPIRRFVLVDSTHQMIRSDAGNLHVFRNRWPRDAALKVATKDEFYPLDENNERANSAIIHIKELLDQDAKRDRPDIVHVYRVTRILERPKTAKKFEGYAAVWTGKVEKVAEEILVKQEEVLSPEDEQLIETQRRQQQ